MEDLGVPSIFMSQSATRGGLCDVVFRWARFLGSAGAYHEIRRKFSHVVPYSVRFLI
jgi:hypothetical protein